MGLLFFVKGLIMGFSIAAPVGPIGVLCIRRTLANGMRSGFISGLGTATADAVYGCIAAFGITTVTAFLTGWQLVLRLGGGLFLIYLGYRILRSRPSDLAVKAAEKGLINDYSSAFILTLTNPMTIMSFAAVLAGLGIGEASGNYWLAFIMVSGVFAGSALWWLILAGIANFFRARLNMGKLIIVNRFSGCLIIGFGILSILSVCALYRSDKIWYNCIWLLP